MNFITSYLKERRERKMLELQRQNERVEFIMRITQVSLENIKANNIKEIEELEIEELSLGESVCNYTRYGSIYKVEVK